MPIYIGVKLRNDSRLYYFESEDRRAEINNYVIVESQRGLEYSRVVSISYTEPVFDDTTAQVKFVRLSDEKDKIQSQKNLDSEKNAYDICKERIQSHGLDMKLVGVEYTFDSSKLIAYFTANGRVDFRLLVKDLANIFKIRIELKQIGVRDEAKLLDGLGPCGRPLCCSSFLKDFEPVSIKMAKEQGLSLNPAKISGICGRLMCCLKYEEEVYEQTRKALPKVGKFVMTPEGKASVIDVNVLKESVVVMLEGEQHNNATRTYSAQDLRSFDSKCCGGNCSNKKTSNNENVTLQAESDI